MSAWKFGLLFYEDVLSTDSIRKLEQILQDLRIRTWVGEDAVISAQLLTTVRDWKGWLPHDNI